MALKSSQDAPRFITPAGLATIRAEYETLFGIERPKLVETISWAAGNGDRSENGDYIYGKMRLREIDRRLAWLSRAMKAAKVVDPATQSDRTHVYFGATVLVIPTDDDCDDAWRRLTIVGDDEINATDSRVGWNSPFAKAFRGAEVGDIRTVVLPSRERDYKNSRYRLSGWLSAL